MNGQARPAAKPRHEPDADIATAPPQQREAIVERLCQAILSKSNGPRIAERTGQ